MSEGHVHMVLHRRLHPWFIFSAALVLVHAAASLLIGAGRWLMLFNNILFFVLILLAMCFAAVNAIHCKTEIRMFWLFMTAGFALWTVSLWCWIYYPVLQHRDIPDGSIADLALFLHIVPFTGAVIARPFVERSWYERQQVRTNIAILLVLWLFIYLFFAFPYQYISPNTVVYNARFNRLYLGECLALIAATFWAMRTAPALWKNLYRNLLIATALYGALSYLENLAIDAEKYIAGGLQDTILLAAVCWYVWVPICSVEHLSSVSLQKMRDDSDRLISVLAKGTLLVIPLIGIWIRIHLESDPPIRYFHMFLVLGTVLILTVLVLAKDWLANRQLRNHENYVRLLLEKSCDVISILEPDGRLRYISPAIERAFGYKPNGRTGANAFQNIHPQDIPKIQQTIKSLAAGPGSITPVEYRIRHADGHWVPVEATASNMLHEPLIRGLLVSVRDVSERKLAEAERERLISELQDALGRVKMLSGLLPICASCKKIRDVEGKWTQVESYIREHSEANFSHGICPECSQKLYPDLQIKKN